MNPQQRKRVVDAMRSQQAKGVGIENATWGVIWDRGQWRLSSYSDCACALGCLLLEEQTSPYSGLAGAAPSEQNRAAAVELGATHDEIAAFVSGFDQDDVADEVMASPWYQAGYELADEFVYGRKAAA